MGLGDSLMPQAREDNAVVGIYYEARHILLRLVNQRIDASLAEIAEEKESELPASELEAWREDRSRGRPYAVVREELAAAGLLNRE